MKKILLISFILLCVVLFTVPAYAMKNEPEKFRGIPWGTKMPKEAAFGRYEWALEKVGYSRGGNTVIFNRLEKASFGGLTISEPIDYEFHWQYGFVTAKIKGVGRANYDLLVKTCVKDWGSPDVDMITPVIEEDGTEGDHDVEMKFWLGENVIVTLICSLEQSQEWNLMFYEKKYQLEQILRSLQQK